MTVHVIIAMCAFLLALLGTRIAILSMRTRRANIGYDNLPPTAQKFLPSSIQGGGIVLVFSVAICLAVANTRFDVLLPLFMLASMALLDKLIPLPWLLQMVIQMFAISIPLSNLHDTTFGNIFPAWMDILIVSAAWMWFMNMLHGMDDVDGFASTGILSISATLCIAMVLIGKFPSLLSSYSLVVASATCGFLWWNWPPSKISLGKVGSIPLGFVVGYLLLLAVRAGYGYAVLIMCAYYISDNVISWCKRTWRSKPLIMAHDEYYYQRALINGRSPMFVVRSVFGINILLAFLAVQSVIDADLASFYLVIAYLSVFILLGVFSHPSRAHK